MNKWVRWGLGAVAALVLIGVGAAAGGGGEDDPQDQRIEALGEELNALAGDNAGLEADLDAANATAENAAQQLTVEQAKVEALETRAAELETELGELEVELGDALEAAASAEAEVESLRLEYDPQIRAELQTEVDAEIDRACAEAGELYDTPISAVVRWDGDWSPVTDRASLEASVEECAAPIRNQSEADREAARLAACETIEVDQVEKNPAAYEGRCVVSYARIVQFDAATGPCSFHAELSSRRSTRWYDYDVRSTFGYQDTELLSVLESDCPDLADIDGDDFIKVWVTGLGSYSYDTSIGGTNTVPSFRIEQVELVRKD